LLQQCPPEPWWVKLADFGISKRTDETVTTESELVGTQEYMAPELLSRPGELHDVNYTKADMWALGVMTFHMLTKLRGFLQRRIAFDRSKISKSLLGDTCNCSRDSLSFIVQTTAIDPAERTTSEKAMLHVWVEDCVPSQSDLQDIDNL
jgi:serine/threonine protein kinase